MEEKKKKKGFFSSLFAPKSSCCCNVQFEKAPASEQEKGDSDQKITQADSPQEIRNQAEDKK